jgi:aryl-alcohol dehydrogenase-like predicted oxidoreductase
MVCAKAAAYCRKRGADIAKLALQFAVANARVHTTLIGTANPENLKKNVKWLELEGDEELLAEVLEILGPVRDKTWIIPGQVCSDLEDPLGSCH